MNNKKNAISSIILQLATIVQGLILPRLILSAFGSETNGLISSVTQFLSFISLLEGGLGAVVLAELYAPIEKEDEVKVRSILIACQNFFNKLAMAFVIYTIVLTFAYPIFIVKSFSFEFTSSMVIILSLTTLIQYLFSITYKLYLQANQKLYIVNLVSTATIILNTISAIVIILVYPEIHVVKLVSGIIYLLQPVILKHFIEKKYQLQTISRKELRKEASKSTALRNRWSGFSQNLAHFINMNTDVALLTVFSSLGSVSVYTVYMLAINALKGIITSIGNSYQSALGKYIAEEKIDKLKTNFSQFENFFWFIGTVSFGTCYILINSFVSIYTAGIHDANYYQPVFAVIITFANMIYVIREPYRLLILAAGKFKETNFGSIAEALINLTISMLLIRKFGLIGVAIGTFVAITYRLVYFIWYLKRDILFRKISSYVHNALSSIVTILCDAVILVKFPINADNFIAFGVIGVICVCFNAIIFTGIHFLLERVSAFFLKEKC